MTVQRRGGHLNRLADALSQEGWRARMVATASASPLLLVANPLAPGRLRDYLGCARDVDGQECYWWAAQAIKIAGVDDMATAVRQIKQALREPADGS